MSRFAIIKDELLVSVRVGWKPELAPKLFTISFDDWKLVDLGFRYTLALCLHNLEFLIVDPDAAGKQTLLRFLGIRNDLGSDVEDVQIQLVDFFFTGVFNIVSIDFRRLQCKGIYSTQIVKVLSGHAAKRRHRKETDLFETITLIVKGERRDAVILADHLATHADALNDGVAFEGIHGQRLAKLSFLRSERGNNPINIRLT